MTVNDWSVHGRTDGRILHGSVQLSRSTRPERRYVAGPK